MLTGRLPFSGETYILTIVAILEHAPPPPSKFSSEIGSGLERIIGKALAKEPAQRYPTARDLTRDLTNLRAETPSAVKYEGSKSTVVDGAAVEKNAAPPAETVSAKPFAVPPLRAAKLTNKIKNRPLAFLTVSIISIAALCLAVYYASVRAPEKKIKSVAVLPFQNTGGDPNLEYLSEGVSEHIIDRLSPLSELKVTSRSSSFKFKGKESEPPTIARSLKVEAIVVGKFSLQGNNLIVRAELVDAEENRQLWSEQFNRNASDLLAVQDEVARTISEKIRPQLLSGTNKNPVQPETVNPQAHELLLKGRYLWARGDSENEKKAVEFFEQAVRLDPNYALAFSELSSKYMNFADNGVSAPKEWLQKAETAANRALQLNDKLADAHAAYASIKRGTLNWAEAERNYTRAIELNPNLARAHGGYAYYLSLIGKHEQALAEARLARELDPMSLSRSATIGHLLYLAGRHDEAIAELKRTLELEPAYSPAYIFLSYVYLAKGMPREAIEASRKTIELGGDFTSKQIYLGTGYARAGERDKARAILNEMKVTGKYVSPAELAILEDALDDKEAAFASLEKAYAERDLSLQYLKVDPAYDSLRGDARFLDLMRRINFPP